MKKKKLRIIHNMARSGSTVMCKCLGSMEGVALLSEQHPLGWNLFNPLVQASTWFNLITPSELEEFKQKNTIKFLGAITLIEERCGDRGLTLVLRDWAHVDYTGAPFVKAPRYSPLIYSELSGHFDIIRISTTRDPVTQWQSLAQLPYMENVLKSGALCLEQFLLGYRKYAELCVETGFIRYEDFLRKPEFAMQKLCGQLEIKFDPSFSTKWVDYKTISGDVHTERSQKIKIQTKRPIDPELRKRFLSNPDYHRACELLGYNPVEK